VGGDFVYKHADGCDIDWKKNLLVKTVSTRQRHKGTNKTRIVKLQVESDSFFHFFNPPKLPEENEDLTEEEADKLDMRFEADYEVGEIFKEKVIPRAVDYFTGKALEYEDYEDSVSRLHCCGSKKKRERRYAKHQHTLFRMNMRTLMMKRRKLMKAMRMTMMMRKTQME
jgi:hypothetical protein